MNCNPFWLASRRFAIRRFSNLPDDCTIYSQPPQNLRALVADLREIERTAERLAQETEFGFLVDPYRQILSIGYEMERRKRHPRPATT